MAASRSLQADFARVTAEGRWVAVDSSNLAEVAYTEGATGLLWVRFTNGSVYAYQYVPPDLYRGLLAAPSKGKYFHRHIRNAYAVYKLF